MAVRSNLPELRFTPTEVTQGGAADLGAADLGDGSDGSPNGKGLYLLFLASCTFFQAIRNNAGVVQRCSYLSTTNVSFWTALFAAAGFAEETFLVNVDGVPVALDLVVSTNQLGPLPFGAVEANDNMTKDGATNVTRLLVVLA